MPVTPRLVLVRHGQASLGGVDYDVLSATGRRQAELTGARLQGRVGAGCVLWTGTLKRQCQTLDVMAPDRDRVQAACLNEFQTIELIRAAIARADALGLHRPGPGLLANPGDHLVDLLAWFPRVLAAWQEGQLQAAGLDSWTAFRDRVLSPVPEWRRRLDGGTDVVVVSSAGVISTLVAELTGQPLAFQRSLAVDMYNASVSELAPTSSGWEAPVLNCVSHLDAHGLSTLA